MKFSLALCFLIVSITCFAQVDVYPPHWWAGMKHNEIQLLIKGSDADFNQAQVTIKQPGISIAKVHALDGKYLAIDLVITDQAKPGAYTFEFSRGKKKTTAQWSLKSRDLNRKYAQGLTSSDFIYFLMPDRFSNGNPANDRIKGMRDQSLNRDSIFHRHGGDIQGIINHLDYLQDLGVTALWLTPVIENDMPNRTEHGYAFTNHYKIEPRFGGEEAYKQLSDELHMRNMKLIQDAVYNHVGLYHFFVQEKPTKDWLHEWPAYTNTTYKDQPLLDPYAAAIDKKKLADGWFTPMMPDLNQNNPYVANFLIQHAIWSVEEFGIDAWRIDTYIYNDLEFMNRCNQVLLDEYPNIFMFGETWVHGTPNQAYFVRNKMDVSFKSNLAGVTDFQTNLYGILNAVNEPFGWTNGVNRLYQTLAQDILYEDPMKNIVFLDNHDKSRFFSEVGEDIQKLKMGIGWLLTTRGIPQLYYGTEILMKGFANPDGWVRLDFKGGWKEDTVNKFTVAGRTPEENDVFNWTRTLARFRKESSAIKTGKLMQYVPENGVYTYFRYQDRERIMCVMNTSNVSVNVDVRKFSEMTAGYRKGRDVISGQTLALEQLSVLPKQMLIIQLQP